MNQNETFHAMLDANSLGFEAEAVDRATELVRWMDKGGLPPVFKIAAEGTGGFSLYGEFARETAYAICRRILDQHPVGCQLLDPEPDQA